jgi:hypothetical protein
MGPILPAKSRKRDGLPHHLYDHAATIDIRDDLRKSVSRIFCCGCQTSQGIPFVLPAKTRRNVFVEILGKPTGDILRLNYFNPKSGF